MADYSRPEYASYYVQLCRELKLEHQDSALGDFYWDCPHIPRHSEPDDLCVLGEWTHDGGYDPSDIAIWLPALSDWREMLEEVGYSALLIGHHLTDDGDERGYEVMVASDLSFAAGELGPITEGPAIGHTPEEAAARLYLAVTQTPAGPAPSPAVR